MPKLTSIRELEATDVFGRAKDPSRFVFKYPLEGRNVFLIHPIDTFTLDPDMHGQFDTVLFLGIMDHIEDPGGGLMRAASICSDHLIISSTTAHNDSEKALMELNRQHDAAMLWIPNVAIIKKILGKLGFTRFDVLETESSEPDRERHIIHAWR